MKRSQGVFDEGPDVGKEREPGGVARRLEELKSQKGSNYMCIRRRRGARCEG